MGTKCLLPGLNTGQEWWRIVKSGGVLLGITSLFARKDVFTWKDLS